MFLVVVIVAQSLKWLVTCRITKIPLHHHAQTGSGAHPIQCVPGVLYLGIRRQEREADHLTPLRVKAYKAWSVIYTTVRFCDMVHGIPSPSSWGWIQRRTLVSTVNNFGFHTEWGIFWTTERLPASQELSFMESGPLLTLQSSSPSWSSD
jgi:hypothetical protein